jgi:hypothetical protein
VNKELSINELKHLLALAEKEIALKNKKIAALEDYIAKLDAKISAGELPDDEFMQ